MLDRAKVVFKKEGLVHAVNSKDSNIRVVTTGDTPYTLGKTFEELNLSPELIKGLYSEMGFEKSRKMQAIILPKILIPPYQNLFAQAHNGSRKIIWLSRVRERVA